MRSQLHLLEIDEERDGFRFRGGSNVIDLPATLQARLSASPRELLNSSKDLSRWLVAAGLAEHPPRATLEDLTNAHALREAIFVLASCLRRDDVSSTGARATLNRLAADSPATPSLQANGTVRLVGNARALLVTLAREAVHLFGSAEAGRIRQCESSTCTLFFVDTSRKGDRRWCSMSACGNKAKVARFRSRRQTLSPGVDEP